MGATNGPSVVWSQYYQWYIGLSIEYPATGLDSYGCQLDSYGWLRFLWSVIQELTM